MKGLVRNEKRNQSDVLVNVQQQLMENEKFGLKQSNFETIKFCEKKEIDSIKSFKIFILKGLELRYMEFPSSLRFTA